VTNRALSILVLASPLFTLACTSDGEAEATSDDPTATSGDPATGDGDGDPATETSGDGDGDPCQPVIGAVTLQRLLAHTDLPTPLPAMDSAPVEVTMPSSIGSDDRIYIVVDYDLGGQTFTTEFMYLTINLSESCSINLPIDLFDLEPLEDAVVDLSGGAPTQLELGPPGGDGINVWDISDIPLEDDNCAMTVKTSISLSPDGGPYTALWSYTSMDDEVRSVSIYAGMIADACV